MTHLYLTEKLVGDSDHTFITEWYCQPPVAGTTYQVIRQEWSEDLITRKIFEVKVKKGK